MIRASTRNLATIVALVLLAILKAWFLWPHWTGCACAVPEVAPSVVTMAG